MSMENALEDQSISQSCLFWLACKLMKPVLHRRGYREGNKIYVAGAFFENVTLSVSHLLMHCYQSWQIRTLYFEPIWSQLGDAAEFQKSVMQLASSKQYKKRQKKTWKIIPLCTAWTVWVERKKSNCIKYRCIQQLVFWLKEFFVTSTTDTLDLLDSPILQQSASPDFLY